MAIVRLKKVYDGMELACEMYQRGIVADSIAYSTLINGLYRVGDLNSARDIFE